MIRAVTNHEWPPVMSILLYYYDSLWANDMVNRLSFLNVAPLITNKKDRQENAHPWRSFIVNI
jgi:hypothetical protein